jgi:DNA primase
MPRIPEDELDRLKRETDLAALVRSRGVELKARGKDLVGRCPFHGPDDEPSLVVTPAKGLFHCFGCGAKGSVIDFVMLSEGISFRHAAELLRDGAQWSAPGHEPGAVRCSTVRRLPCPLDPQGSDAELLGQVVDYYHETLKASPEALAYLEQRGILDSDAITTFRLGYSNRTLGLRMPDSARQLGAQLRSRLQNLGIYRASGHEHLVGSIVIPVFDAEGQVAELYGRKVNRSLRKGTSLHLYLPGPHRGVFNLSALRESREVILCESLIDALTFWVAGFQNVTASFGAGCFTAEQLEAFRSWGTKRVLIAYDRDEAGDRGATAVAEKLSAHGIGCFRVLFPKGMDANAFACKVTPASRSLGLLLKNAEWMGGPSGRGSGIRGPGSDPAARSSSGSEVRVPGSDPTTPHADEQAKESTSACAITPSEAASSLAAAPEPPTGSIPEEIPGSSPQPPPTTNNQQPTTPPPPPPPAASVAAHVSDQEVVIVLGDRRWRVRGLARNMSYEQLKVNLLVSRDNGHQAFHVDTFDLYASRPRQLFVKTAASEVEVKEETIKKDLAKVLLKLEELQDELIQAAQAPKDKPAVTLSPEEQAEAMRLLRDPRLLERIVEDLSTCGLVGEETNKLTSYLAAVSRKLDRPLAVMVQSSSAAGKSALMEAILAFVPAEERVQYSAMTGQSLFYMGEADLKHKVLAIAEEEGAERASYALKLLQSEGKLSIASTGKDPRTGRLVTHEYHVEGPVAIMLTTTAIDLDEELLNRCLVLSVDEDREQTRAIHRMQREAETLEGLRRKHQRARLAKLHQNAQRLLRPLAVVNRYARQLTFLDVKTRTRRDHEKYLALIRAVALLHQHQREVRSESVDGKRVDCVVVTLSDIAVANRLAAEVLGRTLDELPPQSRRFLELVHEMVAERCQALQIDQADYRFSRSDLREHTGWSYPQVRRHLDRLVEMEHVLVHRGGRGQSFVYELLWDGQGRDGETFLIGLVDVDALSKGVKDQGTTPALTPSEAHFDPSLTPHLPPIDPPFSGKEKAAKASSSSTSEPGGEPEAEKRTSGPESSDQPYTYPAVVSDNQQPTTNNP